jgi:hypothetical protein
VRREAKPMPYRVVMKIQEYELYGKMVKCVKDLDAEPEFVGEFETFREANEKLTRLSCCGNKSFQKRQKAFSAKQQNFERAEARRHGAAKVWRDAPKHMLELKRRLKRIAKTGRFGKPRTKGGPKCPKN